MIPIVALDLGGTSLRAALFPIAQPPAVGRAKVPTPASEGPDAVIRRMIELVEEIRPPEALDLRLGVAAPGPLDPHAGVILDPPNLPGWSRVPLRARLEEHFRCPVALGNDANLAALGESRHGGGRGARNLIYLTISTGIGGGVISDGSLLVGARGLAAELGHMTVQPGGPVCGCGKAGHLEAVASGPAIARQAKSRIEAGESSSLAEPLHLKGELSAQDVGTAAHSGDRLARELVTLAGEAIGRHLASLVHAFNPEVIILGGGVSQIGHLLLDPLKTALHNQVIHPAYVEDLRVVRAELGDEAGLVGAMVLASEL